jgi:hypothetical protein
MQFAVQFEFAVAPIRVLVFQSSQLTALAVLCSTALFGLSLEFKLDSMCKMCKNVAKSGILLVLPQCERMIYRLPPTDNM